MRSKGGNLLNVFTQHVHGQYAVSPDPLGSNRRREQSTADGSAESARQVQNLDVVFWNFDLQSFSRGARDSRFIRHRQRICNSLLRLCQCISSQFLSSTIPALSHPLLLEMTLLISSVISDLILPPSTIHRSRLLLFSTSPSTAPLLKCQSRMKNENSKR
jgi:hypothetical protein